jgi:predicted  nucleic acid-binding Zn-ribbon protein
MNYVGTKQAKDSSFKNKMAINELDDKFSVLDLNMKGLKTDMKETKSMMEV